MISTVLIPGEQPRKGDEKIAAKLAKLKPFGDGTPFVIGVRNDSGSIYRRIETSGMNSFVQVSECLGSFALVDELEESGPRDGYDSIFQ